MNFKKIQQAYRQIKIILCVQAAEHHGQSGGGDDAAGKSTGGDVYEFKEEDNKVTPPYESHKKWERIKLPVKQVGEPDDESPTATAGWE